MHGSVGRTGASRRFFWKQLRGEGLAVDAATMGGGNELRSGASEGVEEGRKSQRARGK